MKRIICVAMFVSMLLVSATGHAQFSYGVKGGVNISSVKLSKEIISSENVTGFYIGPMMELMVPLLGIGFDASVLYSQKGIDSELESLKTDYIDVPVNFKWKFGVPVLKGYLAAGPTVGFRVGGDKFWEAPGNIANQIKSKSFAAGLNFGAGIELFKHLQVGFNYGLGLTENYQIYKAGESTEAKTHTWSIGAAYLF